MRRKEKEMGEGKERGREKNLIFHEVVFFF